MAAALVPPAALKEQYERAARCHRAGQLSQALALFESMLEFAPRDSAVLHRAGVVAAQMGNLPLAAARIGRALEIEPDRADFHADLGNVLQGLGRWDQALAAYDRAIAIRPDLAEAHANRSGALMALGQDEAALAGYVRAVQIRPDFPGFHCNQGRALHALRRLPEAIASYERAIALEPRYALAYQKRGDALRDLGRLSAALTSYDQAAALEAQSAEIHTQRGIALHGLKQWQAALESHDRAIGLRPDFADAHANRGAALQALQQWDAALASYDRAIALKPDCAGFHCNRGSVLDELRRFDEALASYDRAIALDPGWVPAHANRGSVLHEMHRFDQALASFQTALALDPDHADAHWNRSMTLLVRGDFERGLPEFEWRWKNPNLPLSQTERDLAVPLWLGSATLSGKTILLDAEQGLGDTIQFCRYAKQVADRGARVILRVQPPLRALLAGLDGVSQVVVAGDALPALDCFCPLMSLPLALATTLSSIPGAVPYLRADPVKMHQWATRLGPRNRLRVGLVWSGGIRPNQPELGGVSRRRNIPLARLAALRHEEIAFYSLQKGQPAESELDALVASRWDGPVIADHSALLQDFTDTAALIENLDLVIAVDTSTAHLAGALGKPVWILNRFDTCWRWMLERTDSPWYPSVTLYRQRHPGDWEQVVERVRTDLVALVNARAG